MGIGVMVLVFAVVLSVQISRLHKENEQTREHLEELQTLYEQETQRAEELQKLEKYVQSNDYIEDVAKSKLGLAYDNEIIFKEE